jgi:hypothetical protein
MMIRGREGEGEREGEGSREGESSVCDRRTRILEMVASTKLTN